MEYSKCHHQLLFVAKFMGQIYKVFIKLYKKEVFFKKLFSCLIFLNRWFLSVIILFIEVLMPM